MWLLYQDRDRDIDGSTHERTQTNVYTFEVWQQDPEFYILGGGGGGGGGGWGLMIAVGPLKNCFNTF